MKILVIALVGLLFLSPNIYADQIKHKFKNPSFSGQGTGAHYLTIENQEKSRKDKIKDDIEAALKAAQREEGARGGGQEEVQALRRAQEDARGCQG